MPAALESLLTFIRAQDKVCPKPEYWNDLWDLLLAREPKPSQVKPGLPLILGGWHYSSDADKRARLADQVRWAADHGRLAEVDAFLRSLLDDQWHCEPDRPQRRGS